MLKIAEHMNLYVCLKESRLGWENVRLYTAEQLIRTWERIQKNKIESHMYVKRPRIERELIENEAFAECLPRLLESPITLVNIEKLLQTLDVHKVKMTDYPVESLLTMFQMEGLSPEVQYLALRHFIGQEMTQEMMDILENNLNKLTTDECEAFPELEPETQKLFWEPFLSHSQALPHGNILLSVRLIAADENLRALLQFLYQEDIKVSFSKEDFEMIARHSERVFSGLNQVSRLLKAIPGDTMCTFMKRWTENGCPLSELEQTIKKIELLPAEQLECVFNTRSSYTNMVYGNQHLKIPLEEVEWWQEDILTYAISHGKKRFLKLLEEAEDTFWNISRHSILFVEPFYRVYVNLNTLTAQNLIECGKMFDHEWKITDLKCGLYTFEEIKALFGLPKQYLDIYSMLSYPKVDQRLVVLREIKKEGCLPGTLSNEHIQSLAGYLSIKPLSRWKDQEFGHLQMNLRESVDVLLKYEIIAKFLPDAASKDEALFLARNAEQVRDCETLQDIRGDLAAFDTEWDMLVDEMEFNEAFLQRYPDPIRAFIYRGGSHIAHTYYNKIGGYQKEAFRRIVKAELMGQLPEVKYHAGDLQQEIDFPTNAQLENAWAVCNDTIMGRMMIQERDDFYSTMLMGELPRRTCMSYVDGSYNECLLSNFDSNKKILYAKLDNATVGRAILRLTKGRFSGMGKGGNTNPDRGNRKASLTFVDLEETSVAPEQQEQLILFLERAYTAHVNDADKAWVQSQFVVFAEKKAACLGAVLVVSHDYASAKQVEDHYALTRLSIYISKSKAGNQYLDSLSGSATVSAEGSYRSNVFWVRQSDLQ